MMSTLRDDSAAAQPERSAVGSAFRGGATTLSPKSSLPGQARKRRGTLMIAKNDVDLRFELTTIKVTKLVCVL